MPIDGGSPISTAPVRRRVAGPHRRRGSLWLAVLVAALLTGGCGADRPAGSLLLVTLDTTRADALGCAGNPRAHTPHLDRLAAHGVRFTDAVSHVPITLPAHSSIFTGLVPPSHGVRDNYTHRLGTGAETLAEVLAARGLATAGFVSSFVLDRRFGLAQGFQTWDDDLSHARRDTYGAERPGAVTVTRAIAWLEEHAEEPFFLFVHLYDPHDPYEPPPPWAERFADDPYLGEVAAADAAVGRLLVSLDRLGVADSTLVAVVGDHGEMLGEHGESTHTYFVYQGALRVPLLLRVPGGPAGVTMTRPVSLVDLAPTLAGLLGAPAPAAAQGLDLAPLLGGAGAAEPPRPIYFESLTPTRYGAGPLLGVLHGRWKLIDTVRPELYDLATDPAESHNLASSAPDRMAGLRQELERWRTGGAAAPSPGEAVVDPEAARRLAALGYAAAPVGDADIAPHMDDPKDLIGFHERHHRVIDLIADDRFAEAEPICRRLAAERPDFWENAVNLGKVLVGQGRWAQAVPALERALELKPGQYDSLYGLGVAHTGLGNLEAAARAFRRAVPHDPEPPRAQLNLARALLNQGRVDEAAAEAEEVARSINEQRAGFLVETARILADAGRLDRAAAELERAAALGVEPLRTAPLLAQVRLGQRRDADALAALEGMLAGAADRDEAMSRATRVLTRHGRYDLAAPLLAAAGERPAVRHRILGMIHLGRGDLQAAAQELQTALEMDPHDTVARNALGLVSVRRGHLEEARRHFTRVLDEDPEAAGAELNLGMVELAARDDVDAAAAHFARAVVLDPGLAQGWVNLGLARLRQGREPEAATCLERALDLVPDDPAILDQLAWLRLRARDPELRDAAAAVELAERACSVTGRSDPRLLATLALAHAAAGDGRTAARVAAEARRLAEASDRPELRRAIERQLDGVS